MKSTIHRITLLILVSLGIFSANGDGKPPEPTPAKTANQPATVVVFDSTGGRRKPQNDDPRLVIRADGSVTLGDRYRENARIETKITKDELQALLQFAIAANDFFKIDAAEIKQSLGEKLEKENEQLKAQGIQRVGADGIADAPTTVVRIHAEGKDHEVRYYALAMQARADERLIRLQRIAMRLSDLERKLRTESAKPEAKPSAVDEGTKPGAERTLES